VPLLYVNIKFLVKELHVMSFHISCDSYYCCNWWILVYYNGIKQIFTLQMVN